MAYSIAVNYVQLVQLFLLPEIQLQSFRQINQGHMSDCKLFSRCLECMCPLCNLVLFLDNIYFSMTHK